MAKTRKLSHLRNLFRWSILSTGIVFLVLFLLSFTSLPFWAYYWLGTSKSKIAERPEYIVLLGGGGMPSESNLMRSYFVYRAALKSPESQIIISIPGEIADTSSTARLVADELILKGIDTNRILFEQHGTNTRSQALMLKQFNSVDLTGKPLLLVSSPEHMRRAVLTFRKAGFAHVSALPAFENALEADLRFKDDELGGNQAMIPDVGGNTTVRYQFWNHLKYEILIARELAALTYYKLRGWI